MSSSPTDVAILYWDKPTEMDRRAQALAQFLGAEAVFVDLRSTCISPAAADRIARCVLVAAETLVKSSESGLGGPARLASLAEKVFVHGFQSNECHNAILKGLSKGSLSGIETPPAECGFSVVEGNGNWCGAFSGLAFGGADPSRDRSFVASGGPSPFLTLIRLNGAPFLASLETCGSQFFLCAGSELADLSEAVSRGASPMKWFSRLVPLLMFLRGALGKQVWRNENPRACVIIDDPLLKSRHGFLDYTHLAASIRRMKYSLCIAFIPWNYRRSDRDVVDLFASSQGALHLCIHGCDHTRAEFATGDDAALRGKAQLALARMLEHLRLSGLPFDRVMVFPQGLFSVAAMKALQSSGFSAAVNTDLWPATNGELTLRDLLDVAVVRDGFPLFGRRYPRDLVEFAFDLFLGKPVLVVEHHEYFRDGQKSLENFVAALNRLDERLQWSTLGTICEQAGLTRISKDGEIQVRFYTDKFTLTNTTGQAQHYLLQRPGIAGLPQVLINGSNSERIIVDRNLEIRLTLGSGQTADILVANGREPGNVSWEPTKLHNLAVGIRRWLCEFRDNHLHTNRTLNALWAGGRALLRTRKLQTATP